MNRQTFDRLLMLIQAEYLERPELRLTRADVEDRWDADRETCEAALDLLVDASVLTTTADGAFERVDWVRRQPERGWLAVAAPASGIEFRSLSALVRAARPRARRPAGSLRMAFEPGVRV